MSELKDKLNLVIENAKFNFFEISGFQAKPRLALLAGAALGYRLGLEDAKASQPTVSANEADAAFNCLVRSSYWDKEKKVKES